MVEGTRGPPPVDAVSDKVQYPYLGGPVFAFFFLFC